MSVRILLRLVSGRNITLMVASVDKFRCCMVHARTSYMQIDTLCIGNIYWLYALLPFSRITPLLIQIATDTLSTNVFTSKRTASMITIYSHKYWKSFFNYFLRNG